MALPPAYSSVYTKLDCDIWHLWGAMSKDHENAAFDTRYFFADGNLAILVTLFDRVFMSLQQVMTSS